MCAMDYKVDVEPDLWYEWKLCMKGRVLLCMTSTRPFIQSLPTTCNASIKLSSLPYEVGDVKRQYIQGTDKTA